MAKDPNAYADEGTIAHQLAAMCLQEGKPASAFVGRLLVAEDYEHAALSPSTAHRWMRCPGSHALETRQKFKPRKFSMQVTQEMADGVQIYLDNLDKYVTPRQAVLSVERKVPVGHITGEEGATGSVDAGVEDHAAYELQAHDLKFGQGVRVDAEENEQLAMYLLGMHYDLAELNDWQMFRGVIHQPRLREEPDEYTWTLRELQQFAERASKAANVATALRESGASAQELFEQGMLVPGDKQCQFCSAKATCPALQKVTTETVLAEFVDLDAQPPVPVTREQLSPIPADNAKLAQFARMVPLVEMWCEAVMAEVESRMLQGEHVPGKKIVTGRRGNRAWVDATAVEEVMKSMRLRHDVMYDYSIISPTQAEKRLAKDHPRQWKKLQELITQAEGKPTVVDEDDKRPALELKPAIEDFENLEAPGGKSSES